MGDLDDLFWHSWNGVWREAHLLAFSRHSVAELPALLRGFTFPPFSHFLPQIMKKINSTEGESMAAGDWGRAKGG